MDTLVAFHRSAKRNTAVTTASLRGIARRCPRSFRQACLRESPANAGKCAQGDSNSHGPNGPQGPQPCGNGSARHDIYWSGSLSGGWLDEGERDSARVKPRELSSCRANGSFSFPLTFPRPPALALRLALRGEGEGLENRCRLLVDRGFESLPLRRTRCNPAVEPNLGTAVCPAADDVAQSEVLWGNVRRAPRPALTCADSRDEGESSVSRFSFGRRWAWSRCACGACRDCRDHAEGGRRVANANAFALSGELIAQTAKKVSASPKRRVERPDILAP